MNPSIAIAGMACRYPDANSPAELWENVLAQRRAFRRMPAERLRVEDYFSEDRDAPDRTYSMEAALIEGYEFDRVKFKVVGSTFRSADLAHWLALDIASQALADAGFTDGHGLPREATGVLLGNTLTGEFSRANLMRFRWPYVRRTLEGALREQGWSAENLQSFLEEMETRYKSPFAPVGEESLAGGLSNTIAGRICNYFDLKGGGYTVDGACASSLLAVANACSALVSGDLDVALAGGVDLSLDPFEIIGFAKAGALAQDEMRVYDKRSAGFWPGEGCGFVVLMRHADALAQGRRIYATIRGWGVSSDGSGGMTRPEEEGQLLALRRAYRRAGFGIETLAYFEGHGTGTNVGDTTELRTLSRARNETGAGGHKPKLELQPAAIGSIKGNFGHTKAAAGIAGLIKATMALHTQVLPPTTACEQPNAELTGETPALRILKEAEVWPAGSPLRAGVSSMGFGGINAHLVLEGNAAERRSNFTPPERALQRSAQDSELFLFEGKDSGDLCCQVEHLLTFAAKISRAELADLAAELERRLTGGATRAAVLASNPSELSRRLQLLASWLAQDITDKIDFRASVFVGDATHPPQIGFLFPGQGSPAHLDGGIHRRRFAFVDELYAARPFSAEADGVATAVAQPAIVTASLAGLHLMRELGIEATVGIGHSLGELTAMHWAGALDEQTVAHIATARGKAMAELGSPTGAMAGIEASREQVETLLNGELVVIAGLNSPRQTVISGPVGEVEAVMARAQGRGLRSIKLAVSHAFHSPYVAAAAPALARKLARETFSPLQRPLVSTITGLALKPDEDLRELLCRQVTSPVRFTDAVRAAREKVDIWIEVGPGQVLTGLIGEFESGSESPAASGSAPESGNGRRDGFLPLAVALDIGGPSVNGLLKAAGAAFVLGVSIRHSAVFAGRFSRPFNLDWKPKFFVNPCELAPVPDAAESLKLKVQSSKLQEAEALARQAQTSKIADCPSPIANQPAIAESPSAIANSSAIGNRQSLTANPSAIGHGLSAIELVRERVAARAELPVTAVKDDNRMLSELHLNSITVGQLVAEAARGLGLPPLVGLNEFANASVGQIAQALEELARTAGKASHDHRQLPPGVDSWIRSFTVEWLEQSSHKKPSARLQEGPTGASSSAWRIIASTGHPLTAALQNLFARADGDGVVVCLPPEPDEPPFSHHASRFTFEEIQVKLLLEAARAAIAKKNASRFVLVQHGWNASGFAKSLHLENPAITTCVVNVPPDHPHAAEWVRDEALSAEGCVEAQYDSAGVRRVPRLKLFELPAESAELPLGPVDVLLVTGGGKGIAAECALALARRTGTRLALLGRSRPETDAELAANLERLAASGIRCRYFPADVIDADAVMKAVAAAEDELGPVTAILHGAGTNVPQLIGSLDEASFQTTLGPKLRGIRNVLAAIHPEQLRVLVTFGSIIARSGLQGEADYAVANEWLAHLTEDFQKQFPQCRCLALEWSVWSGVGMGQRLGRVEALAQQGITPIPPDEGTDILCRLLGQAATPPSVVVTGRFGDLPTLKMEKPELPFLRFLERPKVFYPGVELVVEAELSSEADPYVEDHVYHGERLFPAVMGMEAMAQVAMALAGSSEPPGFEDVKLSRPVVVPRSAKVTIRVAALVREPGCVEVALRSEETGFQADHFRAICRFDSSDRSSRREEALIKSEIRNPKSEIEVSLLASSEPVPLDPARDVYAELLFHTGRFQRVKNYRQLRAKECVVQLEADAETTWFGRYLPQDKVLGDAGVRDAAIHAIQASIPHARLLPIGIRKVVIGKIPCLFRSERMKGQPPLLLLHAREQSRDGDTFEYDLELLGADGTALERWEGLRLRKVETLARRSPWPEALLGPYIERRLEELMPQARISVVLERNGQAERPARSDVAIRQALGTAAVVRRRPDGKPEVPGERAVSVAHAEDFTLAVAGLAPVGCDMEVVVPRSTEAWSDLLGPERLQLAHRISQEASEDTDRAATRVWLASECLKKAGAVINAPLTMNSMQKDGWVLLTAGAIVIATYVAQVREMGNRLAVGFSTLAI